MKYISTKMQSKILHRLMIEYRQLVSTAEKQQWLSHLQTPLIEKLEDDFDHCCVTFLFQHTNDKDPIN